jgi:hypothetical protein
VSLPVTVTDGEAKVAAPEAGTIATVQLAILEFG